LVAWWKFFKIGPNPPPILVSNLLEILRGINLGFRGYFKGWEIIPILKLFYQFLGLSGEGLKGNFKLFRFILPLT